jgi:HEAT repeat protein
LGEIGDPQVIPVLIPFLGKQEADKALCKLGQGDFVDAFHRVLDLVAANLEARPKFHLGIGSIEGGRGVAVAGKD